MGLQLLLQKHVLPRHCMTNLPNNMLGMPSCHPLYLCRNPISLKLGMLSRDYMLRFTGYGPEEDVWTDGMTGCVQGHWGRLKVTERRLAYVSVAYSST